MGRPKVYESHAQRQAAYRGRLQERVHVERGAVEALQRAVEKAADAGDPVAQAVKTITVDSLLRNLALVFERVAASRSSASPPAQKVTRRKEKPQVA